MRDSFKDLTLKELVAKQTELKKKYFDVRVNSVMGHLDNPLEKRNIRRKIARVNFLIHNHKDTVKS